MRKLVTCTVSYRVLQYQRGELDVPTGVAAVGAQLQQRPGQPPPAHLVQRQQLGPRRPQAQNRGALGLFVCTVTELAAGS